MFNMLIFYGWLVSAHAQLIDYTVKLIDVSSSQKTVIVDKGSNSRIEARDFGVLLIKERIPKDQIKDGKNPFIFKPVARLKVAKIFQESSIWVVLESFIPSVLKKDVKLLLLSESALLQGRRALQIKRKKVVAHEKNEAKAVKETLVDDGQYLSQLTAPLVEVESDEVVANQDISDFDGEILDVGQWSDSRSLDQFSPKYIFKSHHSDEFIKSKRVETFEKMVRAFVQKYSASNYSYDEHYNLESGVFSGSRRESSQSYMKNLKEKLARNDNLDSKFYQDLLSKGESWSDGYTDEELSLLLQSSSIIAERNRRELVYAQKYDFQILLSAALNIVDQQNLADGVNAQDRRYDVNLGFDYFLFKDIEFLNRLSFELNLRQSEDGFSVGDRNVTVKEQSLAAQINFYLNHRPNVIDENIFYLAVLARVGGAGLNMASTGDNGAYQSRSFGGLKLGMKYNFINSYGFHIVTSYENIQLERLESSLGLLPDRASFIEAKLGIGLSKFF